MELCNRCNTRAVYQDLRLSVPERPVYKCMACTRMGPSQFEIGEHTYPVYEGSPQWEPRHIGPRVPEDQKAIMPAKPREVEA